MDKERYDELYEEDKEYDLAKEEKLYKEISEYYKNDFIGKVEALMIDMSCNYDDCNFSEETRMKIIDLLYEVTQLAKNVKV